MNKMKIPRYSIEAKQQMSEADTTEDIRYNFYGLFLPVVRADREKTLTVASSSAGKFRPCHTFQLPTGAVF